MRTRAAIAAAVLVAACASPKGSGRLIDNVEEDFTEREVRLRALEYLRFLVGTVAAAGDEIEAAAATPDMRIAAVSFKLNVTAKAQTAAFHDDPVVAAIDLWVLAIQLREFFENGDGKELFGPHQQIVIDACTRLRDHFDPDTPFLPGKDKEGSREKIAAWAKDHPIVSAIGMRPSIAADLARLTGQPEGSLFGTVRNLDARLVDLSDRLTVMTELMPDQVRWHVQMTAEMVTMRTDVRRSMEDLSVVAVSLDRLSKLDERIQEIVEAERDLILERVRKDVDDVIAAVDKQRIETLEVVERERKEIFAEVDRQRVESLELVQKERELILADVDRHVERALAMLKDERETVFLEVDAQRVATLKEVETLTAKTVEDSAGEVRQLIDYIVVRFAAVGGGLIVLLIAGMFVVRRRA